MNDERLLYEVAQLAQFDACDAIWWRWNDDHTQLDVFANCSDVFDWGTADVERITEDNLPVLKQAIADVRSVTGSEYDNQSDAFLLFCARVRQQRPQDAYYQYLNVYSTVPGWSKESAENSDRTAALWALFDACGPKRNVDFCNPKDREGVHKYQKEAARP